VALSNRNRAQRVPAIGHHGNPPQQDGGKNRLHNSGIIAGSPSSEQHPSNLEMPFSFNAEHSKLEA
jgi:hypothetical protein